MLMVVEVEVEVGGVPSISHRSSNSNMPPHFQPTLPFPLGPAAVVL